MQDLASKLDQLREERRKLREQRDALTDEGQGILDGAEKRDLTDEETSRFDTLHNEAMRLNDQIGEVEKRWDDVSREMTRRFTPQAGGTDRALAPGEVRVYQPGEPITGQDHSQAIGQFGEDFRALTTGNWSGSSNERRAMSVGLDTQGGVLATPQFSDVLIDLMRAKARLIEAGALTATTNSSSLTIAKVTGDPTANWTGEHQTIALSDPTLGAIVLRPKKVGCRFKVSLELVEDAPDIGQILADLSAKSLALELDRVGLYGTGASNEPLGIANTSGVLENDLGTNGAQITDFTDVNTSVQALMDANAEMSNAAMIMSPREWATFDALADTTGQPLRAPQSYANLKKLVTTQIDVAETHGSANDSSRIFLGDFSNVLIAFRTGITFEISREASDSTSSAFADGEVHVRSYMRVDVALTRADQLAQITGVIA